ncbi:MAG: response regulator [Planctomycetaceae bacterium]|nr:response regulator [Planctomycetaceae bacterium]
MPTALIVDDEPEANYLLSLLVQLRGYQTESAFTGSEALEKVRQGHPDIVFLDLMLPDINGYEVCKALKIRKTTSLIPVVMVTARIAAENRHQSFRVGADDYIAKPYTPDQIYQAMEDADAWWRNLERPDASGEIRLETRGDAQPLRQIAQLRSLLVGRTTLDSETACAFGSALKELWASADAFGRCRKVSLVAMLAYRLLADRVTLTLCDTSGWIEQGLLHEEGWREVIAPRFDEVIPDETGRQLTLRKRFPAGGPDPAE